MAWLAPPQPLPKRVLGGAWLLDDFDAKQVQDPAFDEYPAKEKSAALDSAGSMPDGAEKTEAIVAGGAVAGAAALAVVRMHACMDSRAWIPLIIDIILIVITAPFACIIGVDQFRATDIIAALKEVQVILRSDDSA